MTPKEILEGIELEFGEKPVKKPTVQQIEAATKAIKELEERYGE